MYKKEEQADLTQLKGKSHVDKEELLELIRKLDKRAKSVCLVNQVTANRPSKIVRLQIKHFDLEGWNLSVYLIKQQQWEYKRLDLETVKAVREYITEYKLTSDDFFIERIHKMFTVWISKNIGNENVQLVRVEAYSVQYKYCAKVYFMT